MTHNKKNAKLKNRPDVKLPWVALADAFDGILLAGARRCPLLRADVLAAGLVYLHVCISVAP
jgi:hypothetical protein